LSGCDTHLDRFVLGFEKTFFDGAASIEFRLPIAGSMNPMDPMGNTAYAGGSFGNLDVILKKVLLANDKRVLAAGLRVETPTGSLAYASDISSGNATYTLDPDAVYLTPFLGMLRTYDDIWFVNSFLQLDIATKGDRLITTVNNGAPQTSKINQPPIFQFDIGGGVWLVTPSSEQIGLAAVTELHLATAIGDEDAFSVADPLNLPNIFVADIPIREILNVTGGLHAQFSSGLSVRAAVSAPLLHDRIFDTEAMVQVNCSF
ncbi:MAG: hypothetical protein AAF483_27225, partial [Planctomycetota bacterium]